MIGAHVAEHVEMDFDEYLAEAVFVPLGMDGADLLGSPAKDVHCTIDDLAAFVAELRTPQLIAATTALEATTNQFGDVEGVVPGLGKFSPCNWGLGPEIRGHKWPHWTGSRNSSSTFGHFGGSGTFIWIDPVAHVAAFSLANREFDDWAMACWPTFSDAILDELGRH
jgi:CubicO group peptidase (beta-lactamase class C family)